MALRGMIRSLSLGVALILGAGLLAGWAVSGEEPEGQPEPAEASTAEPDAAVNEPVPEEESPEQARRRALVAEHGDALADAILAGTVLTGMTIEQVRLARGEPKRKEVIPPDAELWHYPEGEVAFAEGQVSYVSLAEKPASAPRIEPPDLPPFQPDPDRPPQQDPPQVGAPPIRVGDTYVYESMDPDGQDRSLKTRRTVTSTQGRIVLSSLSLDSKKAKPRLLHFNQEWNLLATRNAEGVGLDYSPPLKYYDFPLFPGKTWQQTTTETHTKTGATRIHTVSGSVEGWETVRVPAGTFRAIRVSLQTELFDPSTGERIPGTDLSWYVPEVRRSVKSLTSGKDGSRRLIQLLHYELGPKR